jgi:YfiH family protein
MSIQTNVLVLNEFQTALPWLEHGFGTRLSDHETVTSAAVRQIHSNLVLSVDQPGVAGDADALVTRTPGLALSIRTADCYPILLADPVTRSIAAIHAGWRGTADRIVRRTIAQMHLAFGSVAADLHAAIGPGIGVCCYEVGADVARRFDVEGRAKIDLAEANRRQLVESGVPAVQIHSIGRCTHCEPELFHSYRRDGGQAGRMVSFIRVAA